MAMRTLGEALGRRVSPLGPGAFLLACWTIASAACADNVTELSMEVIADGESVRISFREPGRPECTCSSGNVPALGGCADNSDGVTCTCEIAPASCLARVSALSNGQIVASHDGPAEYGDLWFGYLSLLLPEDADEIRVEGCGGTATFTLPSEAYPKATIVAAEEIGPDRLNLEWTTSPSAPHVFTSGGDGFVGGTCLGENQGVVKVDLAAFSDTRISVQPVDLVEEVTALGTARVWFGKTTSITWPASQ